MKALCTCLIAIVVAGGMSAPVAAGSFSLLGVDITSADRKTMRKAVRLHDGVKRKENDKHWYDSYHSQEMLPGTDRVTLYYVLSTNQLASVRYRFPYRTDATRYRELVDMISGKYGPPSENVVDTKTEGPKSFEDIQEALRQFGRVEYRWAKPGVTIRLVRPNLIPAHLFLYYDVKGKADQAIAEREQQKKMADKRSQERYGAAF
jgi:hypothetical protein